MVRLSVISALLTGLTASATPLTKPASLQQITNSGISNPTNVGFYMYVPNNLATKPGVVTAIHMCTGTAQSYYSSTPYATLAEQYGFIVIFPSSPHSGTCWDVSSQATLTHGGGGDSNAIANMVTWTISKYNADTSKIFVTGTSSGAMMTNVMAATYPELFQAASVYSGVPAGCFVSSSNGVDAGTAPAHKVKSMIRLHNGQMLSNQCILVTLDPTQRCRFIMALQILLFTLPIITRPSSNGAEFLDMTTQSPLPQKTMFRSKTTIDIPSAPSCKVFMPLVWDIPFLFKVLKT